MKILFLYLKAFSSIGGIENFNKCFMKALSDISESEKDYFINIHSLYDTKIDESYIQKKDCNMFNGDKIKFIFSSVLNIVKSDYIVLGHINLLYFVLFSIIFQKKTVLITHGIEVWERQSLIKRYLLNKLTIIISVSNYTKSRIVKSNDVDPGKIKILFNTIDPFFQEKYKDNIPNLQRNRTEKVILSIARLRSDEKYKGYDKVIECIPEIKKRYKNIKYIIAGKGDNLEIKRLNNLIKHYGLSDDVVLKGELATEDIVNLYKSSDLFILPSKGEGFGIVFLEALFFGLPVIAGNKDGSVEPLLSGELGCLVDPDDKNEIVSNILAILEKENKVEDRKNLTNSVLNHFGYNVYLENLKTILNS